MNRRWEGGGRQGRKEKRKQTALERAPKIAERLFLKRMIVADSEPRTCPLPVDTVKRELP